MVDDRRREARHVKGNVTTHGRFGEAPDDRPHMEPEVPPLGIEDAEAEVPDVVPGDLPENRARDAADEQVPHERSITRLPEATAHALEGEPEE